MQPRTTCTTVGNQPSQEQMVRIYLDLKTYLQPCSANGPGICERHSFNLTNRMLYLGKIPGIRTTGPHHVTTGPISLEATLRGLPVD